MPPRNFRELAVCLPWKLKSGRLQLSRSRDNKSEFYWHFLICVIYVYPYIYIYTHTYIKHIHHNVMSAFGDYQHNNI